MRSLIRVASGLALVGALLLLAPGSVSAGFLDLFFDNPGGGGRVYQPEARPLGVLVRRHKTSRSSARKRERTRLAQKKGARVAARTPRVKKVAVAGPAREAKVRRVVRVDVEANPNWHLQDPTLRRGDILVLKGGAVVFEGQAKAVHAREDFASLKQTRLVSKAGQRDIRMATTGIWSPQDVAPAPPARHARTRAPRREASAALQ